LEIGEGEAMIEFFIAIACRRLLFPLDQEQEVCEAAMNEGGHPLLRFLAEFVLSGECGRRHN
jgi:hypothetical protein